MVRDRMQSFAIVMCAPSGTGKTTVARTLLERRDDLMFSVSATTRSPRPGERNGIDYHFIDRDRFEAMISGGELLEWADVHGSLYGTPRSNLEQAAADGKLLILDIDVQGARQVVAARSDTVAVFLLPPSTEILLERLRGRGSEGDLQLRRRLDTARQELEAVEEFEYVVVNENLETTVARLDAIIGAEEQRRDRRSAEVEKLRDDLLKGLERVGM